jgi:hypothetical protein
MLTVTNTFDDEDKPLIDADGKRIDEWSECLTLIAQHQDRAAFTRLLRP